MGQVLSKPTKLHSEIPLLSEEKCERLSLLR